MSKSNHNRVAVNPRNVFTALIHRYFLLAGVIGVVEHDDAALPHQLADRTCGIEKPVWIKFLRPGGHDCRRRTIEMDQNETPFAGNNRMFAVKDSNLLIGQHFGFEMMEMDDLRGDRYL